MKQKITIDKIKEIMCAASQDDGVVLKEKMIACLCCDFGVARRTIVEYINLIIAAGYAEQSINDDGVTIIKWLNK